jgi:hypothetical protein
MLLSGSIYQNHHLIESICDDLTLAKAMTVLSPEELVKLLASISRGDAMEFERVRRLETHESKYIGDVRSLLRGHVALAAAANCFFLETMDLLNEARKAKPAAMHSINYSLFVARQVSAFQCLRASELTATSGYPFQAYTILRNTVDNAVLTTAVLQRRSTFAAIEGIVDKDLSDKQALLRRRKDTEFAIRKESIGSASGLSPSTIQWLGKWNAMFDYEVHGARLSMSQSLDWIRGEGSLLVSPVFNENSFSVFMNRHAEVAWMIHRMLPLLRTTHWKLSTLWAEKWRILDDAYRRTVEALTLELGKPIGMAVSEFIRAKFPFDENSFFALVDERGADVV